MVPRAGDKENKWKLMGKGTWQGPCSCLGPGKMGRNLGHGSGFRRETKPEAPHIACDKW